MSNETGRMIAPATTFLTHLAIGLVGTLAATQLPGISQSIVYAAVAVLCFVLSLAASGYLNIRTRNGLAIVENAVVTGEKPPGKTEFHQAADNIIAHVSRLAAVASKGREQCREVESVLAAFDRRCPSGDGKSNPSRQLTLLLRSLGNDAQRMIDRISNIGSDMELSSNQLETENSERNVLVVHVAEKIDAIAQSIERVTDCTKRTRSFDSLTTDVAENVSRQLNSFHQQLDALGEQVVKCEEKTRMLRDQTVEISSLIKTIHDYASKTDTMALNASIESVRAGEHGRGFAAAADEIRKLTGIISDSAQDVLDRLTLVEGNVDETTDICSKGNSTIDGQLETARGLAQSMSEIRQTTNQSREHLDQILVASDEQLQNVNAIAGSLEELLRAAESAVSHADEESHQRDELHFALADLRDLLGPLTGDSLIGSPNPAQQARPAEAADAANTRQQAVASH